MSNHWLMISKEMPALWVCFVTICLRKVLRFRVETHNDPRVDTSKRTALQMALELCERTPIMRTFSLTKGLALVQTFRTFSTRETRPEKQKGKVILQEPNLICFDQNF